MTHPSVDGDKPNNKKQNKSLTPGGSVQLARNIPQEKHTFLDSGAYKVQGMPIEAHQRQKSRLSQTSQIPCLI